MRGSSIFFCKEVFYFLTVFFAIFFNAISFRKINNIKSFACSFSLSSSSPSPPVLLLPVGPPRPPARRRHRDRAPPPPVTASPRAATYHPLYRLLRGQRRHSSGPSSYSPAPSTNSYYEHYDTDLHAARHLGRSWRWGAFWAHRLTSVSLRVNGYDLRRRQRDHQRGWVFINRVPSHHTG